MQIFNKFLWIKLHALKEKEWCLISEKFSKQAITYAQL